MPFDLAPAEVPDFLTDVQSNLPETDIKDAPNLVAYPLADMLFGSGSLPTTGGAEGWRYDLNVGTNERSRGVGLFEQDRFALRGNMMRKFRADWVMKTDEVLYELEEIARASDGAEIVDTLQERINDMWARIVDTWEEELSGRVLPDNATDLKKFRGLAYYVRMLGSGASDPIGSFAGTTATFADGSTSTIDNQVDRSLVANAKTRNWAATHTGTVDRTLIRQIRFAMINTGFRRSAAKQGQQRLATPSYKLQVNTRLLNDIEEYINSGEDDRKGNAVPFSDSLKIGAATLEHCPALDGIAQEPIYGVNTSTWKAKGLSGRWNKEHPWRPTANASNTMVRKRDWTGSVACVLPRNNFVLHLAY